MSMTPTGIIRTVGLWVLILAIAASAIIDFTHGNTIWAWFKIVVAGVVIFYELFYYFTKQETISTKYKRFIQAHPFWGWSSLALFAIALAGLIVHLSFW